MARKPLSELSPSYRQRIERYAAKHGVSVNESRKAARGHTRSEGHGPAIERTKRGKAEILQVGRPVKDARSYRKGRTPNANDIRKMVDRVKKKNIVIYVEVISSEKSPARRKPDEKDEPAAEWIAIRDTKENFLDDLIPGQSGMQVFERIFQPQRPVEAVISWQIRELDE